MFMLFFGGGGGWKTNLAFSVLLLLARTADLKTWTNRAGRTRPRPRPRPVAPCSTQRDGVLTWHMSSAKQPTLGDMVPALMPPPHVLQSLCCWCDRVMNSVISIPPPTPPRYLTSACHNTITPLSAAVEDAVPKWRMVAFGIQNLPSCCTEIWQPGLELSGSHEVGAGPAAATRWGLARPLRAPDPSPPAVRVVTAGLSGHFSIFAQKRIKVNISQKRSTAPPHTNPPIYRML